MSLFGEDSALSDGGEAKIKTYSLQTTPFLHVDGDIYHPRRFAPQSLTPNLRLPHPLPEDVLAAPLIAQNREIGTHYYRQMMEKLLSYPEIMIPDFIQNALSEESIASYNMGFFGGHDLNFIQRYCETAFRFMEENRMNDLSERCSQINCNVFFEQIIFAVMADEERRVGPYTRTNVKDEFGNPIKDKSGNDVTEPNPTAHSFINNYFETKDDSWQEDPEKIQDYVNNNYGENRGQILAVISGVQGSRNSHALFIESYDSMNNEYICNDPNIMGEIRIPASQVLYATKILGKKTEEQ